jgi:hypothetical protein
MYAHATRRLGLSDRGSIPVAESARPQPADSGIGPGASTDTTMTHAALHAARVTRPLHCIHHRIQADTDQLDQMLPPHTSCSHVVFPDSSPTKFLPTHNALLLWAVPEQPRGKSHNHDMQMQSSPRTPAEISVVNLNRPGTCTCRERCGWSLTRIVRCPDLQLDQAPAHSLSTLSFTPFGGRGGSRSSQNATAE